jgi:hypothetical protein
VGVSRDATHLGHHLHEVRPTRVAELRCQDPNTPPLASTGYRCSARSSDGPSPGVKFTGRNSRLVVTNGVSGSLASARGDGADEPGAQNGENPASGNLAG